MKIRMLLLTCFSLAAFVAAAAIKWTGYDVLGASPIPASQISFNAQAFGVGLLYYALTLAGIASGVVFDALSAVDDSTKITWRYIRDCLASARSWRGLIVSPLIFLTVYVGVKSSPVTTPFVLLAFQNGFFWKAAMARIMNPQPAKG
jgi:hypothetical protein